MEIRIARGGRALALLVALVSTGVLSAAQTPPPSGKMWLLEEPPAEHIADVYGLEVTDAWLEKTRRSGLRYGGGTASFVSPHGLVLTNHHVVRGDLSRMEHEGKNLGLHGYVARTRDEELRIPRRGIQQLVHVEDVTDAVFAGVDLTAPHEDVQRVLGRNRQAVLARARSAHPGLITELVSLYRGSRVHLYVYKTYTDVRVVLAPELGAGYFGGDTDNFRYPRYALDFSLVRVYENGEPLDSSEFHFTWSEGGSEEGQAVFSLGNPGSTDRLLTVAELEYQRDALFPARTAIMDDFLAALDVYALDHPESEAELRELAFGLANSHKSSVGTLQGLRDDEMMAARRAVEEDLRARLAEHPELEAAYGDAWDEIELALEELVHVYERWWYQTPWYGLGQWIRPLQRAVEVVEDFHPDFLDEDRAVAPSTQLVYPFDPEVYAAHLERGREVLGDDDEVMAALLRGMEPLEAVSSLLEETRIGDSAFEAELRAGGWEAIEASDDPAIVAARAIYPRYVENVDEKNLLEGVIAAQAIRIGKATDALEGPIVCPEASFSQRLSAGRVAGYSLDGREYPAKTNYAGLYERCAEFGDEGEFDLPDLWFERKEALDLETALNFVCTVDSAGGSSGSPVFDAESRIVGVLFDGNEQGTEDDYYYDHGENRAIVVDSEGILESITAVYQAPALAAELRGEPLELEGTH
jgi:hypothetical protein